MRNGAMDELELNLMLLKNWFGDEPDERERREAIDYLVEHADEAYPRIVAEIEARPFALDAPALIQVLPRFGREDSIDLLERILASGDDRVCRAAGEALGRHPASRAGDVLVRALDSEDRQSRIGAAIGVGTRRERSACEPLARRIMAGEPVERYYLAHAFAQIGCENDSVWRRLEEDAEADIRALAMKRREEDL
jgi:HEAT repeat protein